MLSLAKTPQLSDPTVRIQLHMAAQVLSASAGLDAQLSVQNKHGED